MSETKFFSGDRDGCLTVLKGVTDHYTYILRRPDGRPFYVEKGNGSRVFQHENEARHPNDRRSNSHKLNVIRAVAREGARIVYEIDQIFSSAEEAFVREEELIRLYKRLHDGGPLTNRHPGGGSIAGPSPFSKAKHAATLSGVPEDDPNTAILNRFVLGIGRMDSVVLKPVNRFKPRPTKPYPTKKIGVGLRQAIALATSAAANGIQLTSACELPRRVQVEDVMGFVENGVSCDIATSGMAKVMLADNPADEVFCLTSQQANVVVGLIGWKKAVDLGLVPSRSLKAIS